MTQRPKLRRWLLFGFLTILLQGTGPCYCGDDDCSNPKDAWCNENISNICFEDSDDGYNYLIQNNCSELNMSCVTGILDGRADHKWSGCRELCEKLDEYKCVKGELEDQYKLTYCSEISSSEWRGSGNHDGEVIFDNPIYIWIEPELSSSDEHCKSCLSSCGCGLGTICTDGFCVPGELEEELHCCGRERGGDCRNGDYCETLDGELSTCRTASRCEPCKTFADCENLDCINEGTKMSSICLSYEDRERSFLSCHEEFNQVWVQNICGDWVRIVQICGEHSRCEEGECFLNLPEIEVSPTLLEFDPTELSSSKTLALFIGNLGHAPLQVSEISLRSEHAAFFSV